MAINEITYKAKTVTKKQYFLEAAIGFRCEQGTSKEGFKRKLGHASAQTGEFSSIVEGF